MLYLALVSLIWAFSFGLIKHTLREVDPIFVATVRLTLALLLLAPFFRWRNLAKQDLIHLATIGAIQFGIMYVAYIQAFKYIPSYLAALFRLTPVYAVLIHDIRQLSFHFKYLGIALFSSWRRRYQIRGRRRRAVLDRIWTYADRRYRIRFGQVAYRDWKTKHPNISDQEPSPSSTLADYSSP